LKDYGPLQPVSAAPKLIFVFREQDRQAARTLAGALKGGGQRERFSFPGFEQLFKTPIEIDANPIVVVDFSANSMKSALERMQGETGLTVPILVMPDDEEDGYFNHKALFTHAGIPSQVCTLGVIQDENTLKWSVANIALQIFCKAGGLPWKVRPVGERNLIIGISQSHKVRKTTAGAAVEKYFAFSILTDSSGLFQKIQVLGESENENTYLDQLRTNLKDVLKSGAEEFSRVVIHTSFKLKHHEIDEIQRVVKETANQTDNGESRFAVVKVNHRSRFFGANRSVNSLVPFEGTRVKLGHGEYLVWFEGIFPDKPTVTKAFPGPTHLQFLRVTEDQNISDEILLQDLVNLSGANWRGFNAKSAPVSIFYCHLVADMVHDFQQRGLPLPAVKDLRPWFL
jgi:argonaute-like protein implicated in RNA metabolism and viral defense